ncbi:MAG: hypothetical protein M3Y54_22115, partial [Bacteroidota bacterium]|nr:hypothetical protein [Bacteroidota bacterium]
VGGGFTAYNGSLAAPDRVLRLNADGSLDNTFNSTSGAGANGDVNALAVQADGKVLAGGFFSTYNGNAAAPDGVLRLNTDGSLDNTFNPGGAGADDFVNALAVQADGRVLVGGGFTAYNGSLAAPDRVLRLNADGSLDAAFNPGQAGTNGSVFALAVQADGRVLAGGNFTAYNGNATAPDRVLRLNADGSLQDGTLAGLAYTWSNGATGPSIAVSQPGDYQATATTTSNGTGYSNVVRVNAPPAVTVQVTPAGPLLLPGGGSATLTATATLAAFNAAGSGFDGNVFALVVQADGKMLVGGNFTSYKGNAAVPDKLLRLNADGSLDTSFNPGGTGFSNAVTALALQVDGKVLVGGSFTSYNGNAAAPDGVLRLNADGSLDNNFNTGGTGTDSAAAVLAVQANGKVLVGGQFTAYNGNLAAPNYLLRLNTDGLLDTSFNNGPSAGASGSVFALAVQADGQVLAGGTFTSYNGSAAAPDYLLRLNTDGSLDTSFNPGGAGTSGSVFALALQVDGKVIVGGSFTSYNGNAAAPDRVLRVNADGSLDLGFNAGGVGFSGTVLALAVQANGKVLAGGTFTSYNGNAAAPDNALRLNADGSLDAAFNPGGAGINSDVTVLALQADGKVFVGGYFTGYNGNLAAPDYLLRLNADGSLNDAATPLAGATFAFNPGNTAGPTRTVSTTGTYTATATDPATGCTYATNAVAVTVALATTVGHAAPALQLYPNPAHSAATLTGARPGTLVRVYDALGRFVTSAPANATGTAALTLPAGLPTAVYVVRAGSQALRLSVE